MADARTQKFGQATTMREGKGQVPNVVCAQSRVESCIRTKERPPRAKKEPTTGKVEQKNDDKRERGRWWRRRWLSR